MLKLEDKFILVISNESWGEIWYSKHNWADELSKKNKVFFVNPPTKWSFQNLFYNRFVIEDISSSLKTLSYNNRLPFTRYNLLYKLNETLVNRDLKRWLKNLHIKDFIFWTFDPHRLTSPQNLNPTLSIYFRVDKYQVKREKRLLNNVDRLLVTSERLLEGLKTHNPIVLSHGISLDEFQHTEKIKYQGGFILYVGNIDFRLDVDILSKLLRDFPNETFIFIGKLHNNDDNTFQEIFYRNKYPNLILHGVEHFKSLKNYIYASKVCLAPMDISVHGNNIGHHKILQYLAMGKPVISPVFNDYINNDEYILGYSSYEEAKSILSKLNLTENERKVQNRINFAKQFLYSNLIKKVEKRF